MPLVVIPTGPLHRSQAEVTRRIGVDIISGCYPQGSALPRDAALTSMFDISRTVLRESFKTLSAKGLLRSKAGVGTRVQYRSDWNMFDTDVLAWHLQAGIDARFLHDLADIRLAVEPPAAALAARRRPDEALPTLRDSLDKMRRFRPDTIDFVNADLQLHLDIATASGNPFMRSIGGVVEAALRISFRLSAPGCEAERERVLAAHTRAVDAIVARDAPSASAAMADIILIGLQRHDAPR